MAEQVVPGLYYYEITDELHTQLETAYLNETDPTMQAFYQLLLDDFNYQSPYCPGKWYAPTSLFDSNDDPMEWDWMEDNVTGGGYAYWFRSSMQPGGFI